MQLIIRVVTFTLILMAGAALPALAWDDVGHRITAYIAWQRMSPAARENVIRILRAAPEDSNLAAFYMSYGPEPEATRKREYFELSAVWPDIVRDRDFETRYKKYNKGNWHYADTFWKQINGQVLVQPSPGEGGQAVERLAAFDKLIRDASASDEQKAIAIAWIMHLGGDIHQPLHTSARVTDTEPKGDQGGNLFLLTPQGTPRPDQQNLHWFWDSIVTRSLPIKGDTCDREYVEGLADKFMKKYPFSKLQNRVELGRYNEWQRTSFLFNNPEVFSSDLKRFEMPSVQYRKNAFRVAEQRLALAGYRLGETMNSVFNFVPPPPTPRTR